MNVRGVRVTRDVEAGELLLVANPIAIIDVEASDLVRRRA
jgi:hypothetical protein